MKTIIKRTDAGLVAEREPESRLVRLDVDGSFTGFMFHADRACTDEDVLLTVGRLLFENVDRAGKPADTIKFHSVESTPDRIHVRASVHKSTSESTEMAA